MIPLPLIAGFTVFIYISIIRLPWNDLGEAFIYSIAAVGLTAFYEYVN